MSIRINDETCIGCGRCIDVCPGSLIDWTKAKKACMKYPKDCWGCVSCVKVCPVQAIDFYLGADMGGRGSTLNVTHEGQFIHWNIQRYDGKEETITVDTREANKY